MQECAGEKGLDFFAGQLEEFAHFRCIDLSPTNMAVSRLIFRVDRNCQRLDCVHVNGGHLLDVPSLVGFCMTYLTDSLLVKSVE